MSYLSQYADWIQGRICGYYQALIVNFIIISSLFFSGFSHASDVPDSELNTSSTPSSVANTANDATASNLVGSQVTQPSEYFGQILISLVLVLVIIFVAAWLLRRYGRFPGVADGNLKVLGALSVGQRERILLLQVGKDQVLVGVTSNKISRLHQLDETIDVAPTEIKTPFAKKLNEALKANQNQSKDVAKP